MLLLRFIQHRRCFWALKCSASRASLRLPPVSSMSLSKSRHSAPVVDENAIEAVQHNVQRELHEYWLPGYLYHWCVNCLSATPPPSVVQPAA